MWSLSAIALLLIILVMAFSLSIQKHENPRPKMDQYFKVPAVEGILAKTASQPAPPPKSRLIPSFYGRNVSYFNDGFGHTKYTGEIVNNSGKDYRDISFKLNVYTEAGALFDVIPILFNEFQSGSSRTFLEYGYKPAPAKIEYSVSYSMGNSQ